VIVYRWGLSCEACTLKKKVAQVLFLHRGNRDVDAYGSEPDNDACNWRSLVRKNQRMYMTVLPEFFWWDDWVQLAAQPEFLQRRQSDRIVANDVSLSNDLCSCDMVLVEGRYWVISLVVGKMYWGH